MPTPHTQPEPVPRPPIKEEPTGTLHDESELISYRNDALLRLISNQEYLEALVKYVHVNNIKPPMSFPEATDKSDPTTLTGDDIYLGNLALMKKLQTVLEQELKGLEPPGKIEILEEYEAQKVATTQLARLLEGVTSDSTFDRFNLESKRIIDEYTTKFHRNFSHIQNVNKFLNDKLADNVVEAPQDYDPRLVNNLINFNQVDEGLEFLNNQAQTQNQQYQQQHQPQHQIPGPNQHHSVPSQDHTGPGQGPSQGKPDQYMPMNDMELGLKPDMELDGINDDLVDMGDDMGDLIKFQGDDEEIINGNFDEDFLSQIDHSME